ncbi:MAG: hypothetical protein H8D45_14520 [Bacteroidetes bacterium]|nr:hypothetical protein [Bacteroidota bacterium]MBL7103306.1 hypothetical protein [Bacteroidales bacterium]
MVINIPLEYCPENKWIFLNELRGVEEQMVSGSRSIDAIMLLDACIGSVVESDFVVSKSASLTIPDREAVLTALYENTYGPKVETTVQCRECKQPFDIDFILSDLISSLKPNEANAGKEANGFYVFTTNNGISFRMCTGDDELAVMGMKPKQAEEVIISRCLIKGDRKKARKEIPKAMSQLAPLIDVDIDTICPDCETGQKFHFNLQSYLLNSIIRDKKLLTFEVHRLAVHYGWGLNEILQLPRSIRHNFLSILETG